MTSERQQHDHDRWPVRKAIPCILFFNRSQMMCIGVHHRGLLLGSSSSPHRVRDGGGFSCWSIQMHCLRSNEVQSTGCLSSSRSQWSLEESGEWIALTLLCPPKEKERLTNMHDCVCLHHQLSLFSSFPDSFFTQGIHCLAKWLSPPSLPTLYCLLFRGSNNYSTLPYMTSVEKLSDGDEKETRRNSFLWRASFSWDAHKWYQRHFLLHQECISLITFILSSKWMSTSSFQTLYPLHFCHLENNHTRDIFISFPSQRNFNDFFLVLLPPHKSFISLWPLFRLRTLSEF